MTIPPGYTQCIGLSVGNSLYEIGSLDLLHACNSTIVYHLEQPEGWGSKFPVLLIHLHDDHIAPERLPDALQELQRIEAGLQRLKPHDIIADIEHPQQSVPADLINRSAPTAADAFVSPHQHRLVDVFRMALQDAITNHSVVKYAIFYERVEADGTRSLIV
jgi:hypothetical protein